MPAKRHGATETKLYRIWCGMLTRCKNKSRANYKWYGGRGIYVCDRWNAFENFRDDMGDPPAGMTLGRIDGDGPYSPENCRWESDEEQHNNRSNNRKISINGKEMTIAQASRAFHIGYTTLLNRINLGWSAAQAVSTPIDNRFAKQR